MPGFIKNPKDEKKWDAAKKAASKSTKEGSDSYWALSNFIYHKMGKTEEDHKMAEMYKKELMGMKKQSLGMASSTPGATATSVQNPMKIGQQATVKKPKAKMQASPFAPPSVFFKSEIKPKHPNLQKLNNFLARKHKISQS